jgi:hypothetical protein
MVVGATRRGKTNLLQLIVQQALYGGAFGIVGIDATGELCAPEGAIRRAAHALGKTIVLVSNRLTAVAPDVTLLPLHLARSEVGPGDLKRTIPDIEDAQVRFIDLMAREFPEDWLGRLDGDTPDLRRPDGSEVRSGANVQTTARVCYYARRLARLVSPLHASHGPLIPALRRQAQAGRVVLIDLAGEGDRGLQSAFQRLCAARLFAQLHEQRLQAPAQFAAAKPFYMTVDEAHRFFDHDAAVGESTFALIAREGNRNKMGLCLFTQLPSDLPHETYANTGITVSFALPSAREREHFVRNAPTDIGVLEAELRDLPVGEAIAAASGLRLALHVRLPRADQVATLLERRVLAPATSAEEGA